MRTPSLYRQRDGELEVIPQAAPSLPLPAVAPQLTACSQWQTMPPVLFQPQTLPPCTLDDVCRKLDAVLSRLPPAR
jgi:hypothetical protein